MVIGGGIAGIACACELTANGVPVVLIEACRALGGRTSSFRDPQAGILMDNCTHVLLGCCAQARRFLKRIGTLEHVDFQSRLNVVGHDRLTIKSSPLPAPLHLLPSILSASYFSRAQKAGMIGLLGRMLVRAPRSDEPAASYLKRLGCSRALLDRLIDPIIVSALNEPATVASAEYARMVLVESLMRSRHSYKLGVPTVPHLHLIHDAAMEWLRARGCEVRLSSRVKAVRVSDGRARSAELESGEVVEAAAFVVATPPEAVEGMGLDAGGGASLRWRPIVSAHLFYEGRTPPFEPACVVNEPFGWVFSRHTDIGYVEAVASAAEPIACLEKPELLAMAHRAAAEAEPMLGQIPLARGIVYRARRATFATLGCSSHRPAAAGAAANLFLAGDWTATGWPSTIEGAVRSGLTAAAQVLRII